MDVQFQLERILRRVQLSAAELELQPEAFQATEELRIASGDLASVLKELETRADGLGDILLVDGPDRARKLLSYNVHAHTRERVGAMKSKRVLASGRGG